MKAKASGLSGMVLAAVLPMAAFAQALPERAAPEASPSSAPALGAAAQRGLMAAGGAASSAADAARGAASSAKGEVQELLQAIDKALDAKPAAMRAELAPVETAPVASVTLVELYTSQGCVNCPPADAYFATLAERSDILPLALHVDYWDYLGWQDPFAAPEFTQRQKAYARARGERMIYTPQLIVAGQGELHGADAKAAEAAYQAQAGQPSRVAVRLGKSAAGYRVELLAEPPLEGEAVVQLVRYAPEIRVEILRGENAGREMDYTNVVTAWQPVGVFKGASHAFDLPVEGKEPAALIVQESLHGRKKPMPGAILAAVRLP